MKVLWKECHPRTLAMATRLAAGVCCTSALFPASTAGYQASRDSATLSNALASRCRYGRRAGGGPADSHHQLCSMAISDTDSPRPSIKSTIVRAAIYLIRTNGCLTVVDAGSARVAPGMSSHPMTEISSGTRGPASWNAHIEPISEVSL